jgi:flagellar basal-body rod protein FlgG
MIQSLSTAATGLTAQQQKIDIIANNIANISTTAYKGTDARFEDTLYTAMENPDPDAPATNLQKGTGVALSSTATDFAQGSVHETGGTLDLMIDGDAFFKLETGVGEYAYTKDGAFSISVEEDGSYLVNSAGHYVLDANDERIRLPEDSEKFTVRDDGTIDMGTAEAQLGIYSFDNAAGLFSTGGNLFTETAASGAAAAAEDYTVIQGALEGSNVDLATQLTSLMQAQRVFSLASRALQTADEMEGLANNMRH